MSERITNDGRNAVIDALVAGKDITVAEAAVGDGETPASVDDAQLANELERYTTDNRRSSTGSGRFDFTIPETSNVDNENLTEVGLQIDPDGEDLLYARLVFPETPKANGSRLEFEVESTLENPS